MAQLSTRTLDTDAPVVDHTRAALALNSGAIGLAQGVVYWPPPPEVLDEACRAVRDPSASGYGPDMGNPDLQQALKEKVAAENGLHDHGICVTHGAQQAFVNVMISLTDPGDRVLLVRPCYFDHHMSICQLGGGRASIAWCSIDGRNGHPDFQSFREILQGPQPPKLVALTNPCNPTGTALTSEELQIISDLCSEADAWLVLDETYENFYWGGRMHATISAPHVVHIFSFSKAFGMMGWRCGYIAYPDFDGNDKLGKEFIKCQDTVCICASQISQCAALAALKCPAYRDQMISTLEGNRKAILDALSPIGQPGDGKVFGGEGAFYLFFKLPPGCEDDIKANQWLVREAGVCLVPGSPCYMPGHLRVSFGNLPPGPQMEEAAARLKRGLTRLVAEGLP